MLRGFAFGVLVTTCVMVAALRGRDDKWQVDAVNHGAAVFRANLGDPNVATRFQWLDDYAHEIEMQRAAEQRDDDNERL